MSRAMPRARRVTVRMRAAPRSSTWRCRTTASAWTPKPAGRGFGLAGMRERVESLGGTVRLGSSRGRGVALQIELPLAAPAGHA